MIVTTKISPTPINRTKVTASNSPVAGPRRHPRRARRFTAGSSANEKNRARTSHSTTSCSTPRRKATTTTATTTAIVQMTVGLTQAGGRRDSRSCTDSVGDYGFDRLSLGNAALTGRGFRRGLEPPPCDHGGGCRSEDDQDRLPPARSTLLLVGGSAHAHLPAPQDLGAVEITDAYGGPPAAARRNACSSTRRGFRLRSSASAARASSTTASARRASAARRRAAPAARSRLISRSGAAADRRGDPVAEQRRDRQQHPVDVVALGAADLPLVPLLDAGGSRRGTRPRAGRARPGTAPSSAFGSRPARSFL